MKCHIQVVNVSDLFTTSAFGVPIIRCDVEELRTNHICGNFHSLDVKVPASVWSFNSKSWLWKTSHQECKSLWLIYIFRFRFSLTELITTVTIFTLWMWKRCIQFEVSIKEITVAGNFTPNVWTPLTCLCAVTEIITAVKIFHACGVKASFIEKYIFCQNKNKICFVN